VAVTVQCTNGTVPSSPLQVNNGDSTNCTATVQDTVSNDTNNNPRKIMPTGTVSWAATPDYGAGSFTINTCTLVKIDDATAGCPPPPPPPQPPVTYKPTSIGDPPSPYIDTQHIVASYNPDFIHTQPPLSSPATNIYAADQHPATVTVTCNPATSIASPLILGGSMPAIDHCTAWVVDSVSGRPPITPTGNVTWSGPTGGAGFAGSISTSPCTLAPVDSSTAQCAIDYQPTTAGTNPVNAHQLTASYGGDPLHPGPSTGSGTVFVANIHAATVQISCVPSPTPAAPLVIGPPATTTSCTFSVKDPSPSPVVPTGNVTWNVTSQGLGGTGNFAPPAPGPCALVPFDATTAQCTTQVTYTPTILGNPDGSGPGLNTHMINVAYQGDTWHTVSSNSSNVSVHN
jgi:hypothetical protein